MQNKLQSWYILTFDAAYVTAKASVCCPDILDIFIIFPSVFLKCGSAYYKKGTFIIFPKKT